MVTLDAASGNGHLTRVLIDHRIAGGHIFVSVGLRGRVYKIINLSDIQVDARHRTSGVAWVAVTFITFVSANGNAR